MTQQRKNNFDFTDPRSILFFTIGLLLISYLILPLIGYALHSGYILVTALFLKYISWGLIVWLVYLLVIRSGQKGSLGRACLNCGRNVPMDGLICPYCGNDLSSQMRHEGNRPRPPPDAPIPP